MAKRKQQPPPKKAVNRKKISNFVKKSGQAQRAKSVPELTDQIGISTQPDEHLQPEKNTFFTVGIGASAGGLEACMKLLESLPPDTGMAFVVVQHLDPLHESMLTDLLSKATSMHVSEVKDGMLVEPNHVYVISPNKVMTISQDRLHLLPRAESPLHPMPIDSFFQSLAEDHGQQAIGVILSGTGSDGSLGVRAIKAKDGLVFAQDEHSARYNGMPRSAVETGAVDFVLTPEKIASELVKISRHSFQTLPAADKTSQILPAGEGDLNKIFLLIKTARGVDFTYYKRATILRRIHRRMLIHKMDALEKYVRYLQGNPSEVGVLFQEILINVTSFFREPETFNALKNVVFPRILENNSPNTTIRVWVPGCSTGEEVYSLAMCFAEFCEERGVSQPVQFFASDIDEEAVEKARQGVYPDTIAQDVSPERLRRFFFRTEQGYQISKSVRERCIFARHNLIKDPPFSRMDLISCRNLLIYFGKSLQEKTLPILHYALKPTGYLMLGKSESIGEFSNLLSLVNKPGRIYSKKTASTGLYFDREPADRGAIAAMPKEAVLRPSGGVDIQKETDAIILDRYGPPGLVINKDLDILQFRGNISPYLKPTSGKASLNLMKMAGDGLAVALRSLIREAAGKDLPVKKAGVKIKHNGSVKTVTIEVVPLRTRESEDRLFLAMFEDITPPASAQSRKREKIPATGKTRAQEGQIASLTSDLAATQEQMRSIIAEHEASAEELKALNEEVQSSNEELQSVNEELETSSEELQSTNEELNTVNDELSKRNEEVTQLNNDLINTLSGVEIPILLLGSGLQIRRFNSPAGKMLNLVSSDIGRGISTIKLPVDVPDIDRMIREVIDSLTIKEQEIQDRDGRWHSMTMRPYKTVDNRIEGALMTFQDINDLKVSMSRIMEARDYARAIVETVREPLIVLSRDLRVVTANQAYYRNFEATPDETESKSFFALQNGLWTIPRLRELLEDLLLKNAVLNDFEVEYQAPGGGRRLLLMNARRVVPEDTDAHLILLAIEDLTERRRAEEALRQSEKQYHSLFENMLDGFAYCKMLFEDGTPRDFMYLDVNSTFEKLTGLKNVVGKKISEVAPGLLESYPKLLEIYGRVASTGNPESFEIYLEPLAAWLFISVYSTEKGYFVAVFDNITERKRAEDVTQARLRMLSAAASTSVTQNEALKMALDEIEAQTGSTIGFYHFLDADQETLTLQSWSTNTLRNMCTAEGQGSHYNISQAGVWVDCVRERRTVIHNDYASLARRKELPPGHAAVIREMVVPISRGGRIVAIIGVGNKPNNYTANDVELAQSLGDLSWEIVERIRAVEALNSAHAELELRTLELAATNKELEAFSYSVSHDLRAPLRRIEGFIRILLEDYSEKLDDTGKGYLQRVSAGSQRMKALVDALLSLSRYTSASLNHTKVYLSALVKAAAAESAQSWPERRVELVIADGVTAEGDPTMLQVVINNLVWNSWKFTQKRSDAKIEFGVTEIDGKAVYYVRDNGAGFNQQYGDKLFTPFQRLHSDDEFPGLGIGLATVQRIIHRHGGRIWAEGEVDKGATFYFTL